MKRKLRKLYYRAKYWLKDHLCRHDKTFTGADGRQYCIHCANPATAKPKTYAVESGLLTVLNGVSAINLTDEPLWCILGVVLWAICLFVFIGEIKK